MRKLYMDESLGIHHSLDKNPLNMSKFPFYDMHVHDNCEIYYFMGGDCSYIVEGRRYPLVPGSILLMRPAEAHCLEINGNRDYERISVNIFASALNGIDPDGLLFEPFFNRGLGERNLYTPGDFSHNVGRYLMQATLAFEKESGSEKRLIILANVVALLYELRSAFLRREREEAPGEAGTEILDHINNNLGGDLSLDALCELFHLSKSQLNRRFRRLTGTTIGDYVSAKRLLLARELISSGTGALATSRSCGFKDYSTFYRAYVKKYGAPPSSREQIHF